MLFKLKTTFTPPLILEIFQFKESCNLIDQEYFGNNLTNNFLPEIGFLRNRQEHQTLISETEKSHFKNES